MNKILRAVLLTVLSTVLIWSLAGIGMTVSDYKKADAIYDKVRDDSFHAPDCSPETASAEIPEEYFPEASVDLEALEDTNPEVVGWLWIPDTEINFPLLRSSDNWKYLSLSYDLQQTNSGSIFMDFRNSANFSDDNTIIYGHNMKSGGMFGKLKNFADSDYLNEHPELYIFTETQILKYRIFAAYKTKADSASYTASFSEEPVFLDFIEYVKNCAGENIAGAPAEYARLITLSTCTSEQRDGRFVVHACFVASKRLSGAYSGTAS
ncbi:MAG: class B sortase [Oscillospiraceae bacterium]|nr:class B sortase [Oscillospiraceae bacterium]